MARIPLAILFALPLTIVGCGDGSNGNGGDPDCTGANCGDDDTGPGPDDDFAAVLRSVAPYGWAGNHRIEMIEPEEEDIGECTASASCDANIVEVGNFEIRISGDTFTCVPQVQLVDVNDNGATVSVSDAWLETGACGLTPDNDYSGWNVRTDIGDLDGDGSDEVVIYLESWESIVTGDTFYYENDEYVLEGTISEDLEEIWYHIFVPSNGNEEEGTLYLE